MAASKKTTPQIIVLGVCHVERSKEELRSYLLEQVKKGNDILNRYPVALCNQYGQRLLTQQQEQDFFREHDVWADYCEEIYTSSFDDPNTKYLEQFRASGTPIGIYTSANDVYIDSRRRLADQISAIESFLQRLDLIFPNEELK